MSSAPYLNAIFSDYTHKKHNQMKNEPFFCLFVLFCSGSHLTSIQCIACLYCTDREVEENKYLLAVRFFFFFFCNFPSSYPFNIFLIPQRINLRITSVDIHSRIPFCATCVTRSLLFFFHLATTY